MWPLPLEFLAAPRHRHRLGRDVSATTSTELSCPTTVPNKCSVHSNLLSFAIFTSCNFSIIDFKQRSGSRWRGEAARFSQMAEKRRVDEDEPLVKPVIGSSAVVDVVTTPREPSLLTRLVACLQYGAVSVSITLFNRAVFSVYSFNFPGFVTLVQIFVSIAFIYALKAAGYMETGRLTMEGARKVEHWGDGGDADGTRPPDFLRCPCISAGGSTCHLLVVVCDCWRGCTTIP